MKRDYLSRLTLWARWYLPEKEAAEVLEDYEDLIAQDAREEADLQKDVGKPREAARRLVQPKTYRRWLTVFAVLTVCVLLPALAPLNEELSLLYFKLFRTYWWLWGSDITVTTVPLAKVFLLAGVILALFWFRKDNRREPCKRLPKGVPLLLILLLIGIAWMLFLAWVVIAEPREIIELLFSSVGSGRDVRQILSLDVFIASLFGMLGLIKARIGNRRWLPVYILGLTGSTLGLFVFGMLSSMSFYPGWQTDAVLQLAVLIVIGLAGTAVSLC